MAYDPNDSQEYSPLTNPASPGEIGDYGMETPGGTTTRIVWNEKGVLDTYVYQCAQTGPGQSLRANNDKYRVGVYATTSVGDYD